MRSKLLFLSSLLLLLASCTPTYIVTFSGSTGGSVSNIGGEYDEGATVSVSAQPETGYEFTGWSDGSSQNPRTITVSENLNLTALFNKQQFSVSVNTQGEGTVATSGATGQGSFEYGSSARFEAVPAAGWEFDSWSGDASGTSNPLNISVDAPLTITATFVRKKYDLTVTVQGEGTVTEQIVVQPGRYDYETQVKLTAVPKVGWLFDSWSGDLAGNKNPITIELKGPKQITANFIKTDFGEYFPQMLREIIGHQTDHNLLNDSYVRHYATPTPFQGGVNNTTYYIRWNSAYWNRVYNNIMTPGRQAIQIAEADGYDMFVAWAKLIRIVGASRLSAYYGPIIYSKFGSQGAVMYDSEPELYATWFSELDEIVSTMSSDTSYSGFKNFDASYGGSVPHWIKLANSLRLQLAMRISKVNPSLAKTEGEKAINNAGGLITTNSENFMISLYGRVFQEATISFAWGDTRMSASMESILGGYSDPRVEKYWAPVSIVDKSLVADHPEFQYKGIRNGAELVAKEDRLSFSTIAQSFNTARNRKVLDAAEVHLLLAEANLRGWTTPLTAHQHYEEGVKQSFAFWGAGGVDAYLANDTGLPLDYDDPKASGAVNDFKSRITTTVAWDESASNEVKLEKIITQKWIAAYTNSVEAWVDHRRTGYPKLPYNYQNDSNSDWGIIAKDDFLKRHPFPISERNNNPIGIADATSKLGGPDEIGTRLWWDTGGPNF